MLEGLLPQITVEPLITVNETLPGGYRFEAIPDGIAVDPRGTNTLDIYVNHETSTVPFPANQTDFDNAQMSRLVLKRGNGKILWGEYAIPSSANYQRFCSNYFAGPEQGFDRPLVLTSEEATDSVNRTGIAWPLGGGGSNPEQAGVVVAYDPALDQYRSIYGMGRLNHENAVAIPGFNEIVVLSGDDTFTSNPAGSQVYAYIADDADDVWNDEGSLWGFRADNFATYNDYYDVPVGSGLSIPGELVQIPHATAIGDQAALEAASDALGVFQFVRIEDIAYDRNDPNVVYLADSGRGATTAGGNAFTSSNGRIWKMVLDPANPRNVVSLSVLIEGDDSPVKTLGEIHQPDNLETTAGSLFITEDPGSSQQFLFGSTDPNATTARIWRYDLASGAMAPILRVDQSADEGPTDVDGTTGIVAPGNLGAWEASGIVDVSQYFGRGAFLVTVQAHSLFVEKAPLPSNSTILQKREGGQLLLVRIPGA